ncbi:penicillin-binding protein [Streptomyces spiroverticillatus]|uniref:Penicillin-binding protein n=1 Tax=Streptomyces finlayi TaxID=67296 RepID=A0A918X558_9ACTN|nr:penicillin-binding transpeptidase domain-containing protein [Streptomyces finlayi]GHA35285.1 penicillin-binding protein [Streptomyces spiroverticillatus]GHD12967.1 penicillin-binding protein [Streptomyces finlayi]
MGGERRDTGGRRKVWVAGVASLALAGAGIGAWAAFGGDQGPRTGPPTASEVESAAESFLAAWADGDVTVAAEQTDDAKAAEAALRDFTGRARLEARDLRAGQAVGARVPYAVKAEFGHEGARADLTYETALTVVRRAGDGEAVVHWEPRVLHPRLTRGTRLAVRETGPAPVRAVDREGRVLDVREFPSLGPVVEGLRRTYAKEAGGRPGLELRAEQTAPASASTGTDSEPPRDTVLLSVPAGAPAQLRTTLDSRVQKAAEREVAARADASIVVMKPSSGEILAVANSRTGGPNTALEGRLAPGSTMKMITASLLLEKRLAAPDKPHPCPKTASYGGWPFHNVDDFDISGGTFRRSFAASCNTAFITQAARLADADLSRQAQDVFGIGGPWTVGLPAFTGSVPVEHAASKAAALIGQGQVRMNPLTMASVVSTARTGRFVQPRLVAPGVGHRAPATARRALDGAAHEQLRDLLRTTATSGSASGSMRGLKGDIGAKTGSAEVIGQEKPNGWFAAWHGDVAAAAVMQRGGRGGESAGPLVGAVLRAVDAR